MRRGKLNTLGLSAVAVAAVAVDTALRFDAARQAEFFRSFMTATACTTAFVAYRSFRLYGLFLRKKGEPHAASRN